MRILVTGASGFLGRAIVAAGAEAGHHMIAASRTGMAVPGASAQQAVGDLAEGIETIDLSGVEAVIHCAARVHVLKREDPDKAAAAFHAMNTEMTLALARAAQDKGASHFIQISSVAALASRTPPGVIINDTSEPAPTTPYGASKLAADHALAELASDTFRVISLRPPALYGPGVGAWFAMLMRAARAGLPLPLGAIRNLRSFAYVGNVADAAVASTGLIQSGSFIVTDSLPISTGELYQKLLAGFGHRNRVWAWPQGLVRVPARIALGDRSHSLLGDAAFDGARFARIAQWEPRVDMDEALGLTLDTG